MATFRSEFLVDGIDQFLEACVREILDIPGVKKDYTVATGCRGEDDVMGSLVRGGRIAQPLHNNVSMHQLVAASHHPSLFT